jgi:hypothetical protein
VQALAYFRWINHAQASAPEGRPPLLINLDETSLSYSFIGSTGTVVCSKHIPPHVQQATEDANTADTHGHVSYVAMVTHDTAIQPLLPQVLLGNEHRFTQTLLKAIKPEIPPNIVLLRQKSAWNCHSTMRAILSLLAKALGKHLTERYVILILDVHSTHIHASIFAHARRLGIRLVYIPAKLTYLLQPCDTHVFSQLKHALREAWRNARSNSEAAISATAWLLLIFRCIRIVLQGKPWLHAFQSTGALTLQQCLAPRVFYRMGLRAAPVVPPGPPTQQEARVVFPKNVRLNVMSYVLWCRALELNKGSSAVPGAAVVVSPSSHLSCVSASSSSGVARSSAAEDCVFSSAVGSQVPERSPVRWVLRPRVARALD